MSVFGVKENETCLNNEVIAEIAKECNKSPA